MLVWKEFENNLRVFISLLFNSSTKLDSHTMLTVKFTYCIGRSPKFHLGILPKKLFVLLR
jgi:hypothetical protein